MAFAVGLVIFCVLVALNQRLARRARESGQPMARGTRLTAVASLVWGVVTALVFVPGGAFLSLVLVDRGGLGSSLLALALAAICIVGLVTAIDLVRVPGALLKHKAIEVQHTAKVAALHHLGVAGVVTAIALGVREPGLMAVALPCCAIGVALAACLARCRHEAIPTARAVATNA